MKKIHQLLLYEGRCFLHYTDVNGHDKPVISPSIKWPFASKPNILVYNYYIKIITSYYLN